MNWLSAEFSDQTMPSVMHASSFTPIHRPTPLPRNIKPVAKAKSAPAAKGKTKEEKAKAKDKDKDLSAGEKAPKPKRNPNETDGGEEKPGKPKKRSRTSKN